MRRIAGLSCRVGRGETKAGRRTGIIRQSLRLERFALSRIGLVAVAVLALVIGGWMPLTVVPDARAVGLSADLSVKTTRTSGPGKVWWWGDSEMYAFGNEGPATNIYSPVQMTGLTDVTSIAVGGNDGQNSAFALDGYGNVWAWGFDDYSGTGNGCAGDACLIPKHVPGLSNVTDVVTAQNTIFALDGDRNVWAWGANDAGSLGLNANDSFRSSPAQVPGLTDVTSITTAFHSVFALDADGNVWAWGLNSYGQLGIDSDDRFQGAPAQVAGLTDVTSIITDELSVYALDADGNVWAWGDNYFGQLGINTNDRAKKVPVRVPGLTNVTSISAGTSSVYALDADGNVWAWGYNNKGQLGNNSTDNSSVPVKVPGLTNVASITADGYSAYALDADGNVWAWGDNDKGKLGIYSTDSSCSVPEELNRLPPVTSITAGAGSVFGRGSNGQIWAWGSNTYGQLGINSRDGHRSAPAQVPGLSDVTSIVTGDMTVFAIVSPTYDVDVSVAGGGGFGQMVMGGGVPSERMVTVANTGSWPTGALRVALSGSGGSAFTVSATSLPSIAAQGQATFTVVPVTGLAVGSYAAALTVSGLNGISQTVLLSFEVTSVPVYSVDMTVPGGGDLGSMVAGGAVPPERIVTVANTGNRPTGVLAVGLSGLDATAFTVSTTSLVSVGVGGQVMFSVALKPGLSVKSYDATLTVSGAHGISRAVLLSFEVMPVPVYSVGVVVSAGGDFDSSVDGGSVPGPRVVTVENTGDQPTGALTVGLSGTGAMAFSVSAAGLSSIQVGGQDTFTVNPVTGLSVGVHVATLTVSGSNGISQSVTLSFEITPVPVYSVILTLPGGGDLGSMVVGGAVPPERTVTVTNTGNRPTGALTVGLAGVGSAAFTVSTTSLGSIPTSGRDTFKLQPATSLSVGTYTATLTVSGANGINQTMQLSFEVASVPVYSVGVVVRGGGDFGSVIAGVAVPPERIVTITNTGNQVSGGLTVGLLGNGASAFTVSTANLASVGVGGQVMFTVTAAPALPVGSYDATLTVSGSHGIQQSVSLSLTVTPVPSYSVSVTLPGGGHMGSITVGGAVPAGRIVTVANTGNQPTGALTIALSSGLAFTASSTSVTSIPAGGQDTFTVGPASGLTVGSYSATLTVQGANGISQIVPLSFEVTPVEVYAIGATVSGGDGDFGSSIAGSGVPLERVVTVSNNGNQPTGALSVGLSGANGTAFTVSAAGLGSIPINGQDTFTVEPKSGLPVGVYSATVTVSGAHSISQIVSLRFEVTPFPVYFVSVVVSGGGDFGSMIVGGVAPTERIVTVTNTGNQPSGPLTVGLSGTGVSGFEVSKVDLASVPIDGQVMFTVSLKSGLPVGSHSATLTVSGSHSISQTVPLTFEVTPVPDYGVDVTMMGGGDFGSIRAGGSVPSERTVTVSNTGTSSTGPLTVALSGAGSSAFTASTSSLASVLAGDQVTFTVAPTAGLAVGVYAETLTVFGAHGISQTVTLRFAVTAMEEYGIGLGVSGGGDFGSVTVVGSAPRARLVTVANIGNQATGILNVALTGKGASAFTLSTTGLASIAKDGRAALTIAPVTGLDVGVYSATLTVSGKNSVSQTVPLAFKVIPVPDHGIGLGVAGGGDFGSTTVAGSAPSARLVTVANIGNQPTGILTVELSGTDASAFSASTTGLASIDKAGQAGFTVAANSGLAVGHYSATLTVSGANDISQTALLTFEVIPVPDYGVELAVVGGGDFGATALPSSVPAARLVTVTNIGNEPTSALNVALSGTPASASAFTVSTTGLMSIAKAGQAGFTVAPETGLAIGVYSAALSVSGANGIYQTVLLAFEVKSTSPVAPTDPSARPSGDPSGRPSGGPSGGPSASLGGQAGSSTAASGTAGPPAVRLLAVRAVTKKIYVQASRSVKLPVIVDAAPGQSGNAVLTWKVTKPKKVTVSIGGGKPGKAGTGSVTVTPGKPFIVNIRGAKVGKAAVTLTAASGAKIKVKVNVAKKRSAVKGLSVKAKGLKKKAGKYTLKLKVGKSVDLKVKPVPAKQTTAVAKFKAKNAVRVDVAGRVTALKKGKAKITVKLGKRKTTIRATVK